MQTLILGLPRNGKGLYGAQLAIDELVKGDRCIIGNFAFEKLPWATRKHELRRGLLDYLELNHKDTFNASERVFRISDDATSRFYLYRALSLKQVAKLAAMKKHLVGYRAVTIADGVMTEQEISSHKDYQLFVCDHELRKDKNGREILVSFNPILLEHSGGHLNIADECWRFWPARSWQSTSEADVFYSAQHGKFGDDCLFITHRHNDIDSVIVDRCQQTAVVTHHGKLSMGMFRQPDVYSVKIYSGRPSPSKEPMSTKRFRLDAPGLGGCYDTSAGVGVTGRGDADRGARKTGIPFWVMPFLCLCGIAVLIACVHFGFKYLSTAFRGRPPKTNPVEKSTAAAHTITPEAAATEEALGVTNPGVTNLMSTNEVFCTGWVRCGSEYLVFTSDGNTYSSLDKELDWIQKRKVSILGKTYRIAVGRAITDYEYQQLELPPYETAPPLPVNRADVTYIGNSRVERSMVSGIAAHMNRNLNTANFPQNGSSARNSSDITASPY